MSEPVWSIGLAERCRDPLRRALLNSPLYPCPDLDVVLTAEDIERVLMEPDGDQSNARELGCRRCGMDPRSGAPVLPEVEILR